MRLRSSIAGTPRQRKFWLSATKFADGLRSCGASGWNRNRYLWASCWSLVVRFLWSAFGRRLLRNDGLFFQRDLRLIRRGRAGPGEGGWRPSASLEVAPGTGLSGRRHFIYRQAGLLP